MTRATILARAGAVAGSLGLLGLPLFNHFALSSGHWITTAALLTMAQLSIVAAVLIRRSSGPGRMLILAGAVVLVAARSWSARAGLAAGVGLCHAALYLSLLVHFTASLRAGRRDVVSGLALRMRANMRPDMLAYTRNVTRVWSGFFALQLVTSAVLWSFAPVEVWSLFVNVLDLPLVACVFVAEYAVRLVRFRHDEHAGFVEVIRAWRVQPPRRGRHERQRERATRPERRVPALAPGSAHRPLRRLSSGRVLRALSAAAALVVAAARHSRQPPAAWRDRIVATKPAAGRQLASAAGG